MITLFTVCNGCYWDYLSLTSKIWNGYASESNFQICHMIGTLEKNIAVQNMNLPVDYMFFDKKDILTDGVESKSLMFAKMILKSEKTDYFIFVDADIIPPRDIFEKIKFSKKEFIVGERVNMNYEETKLLFEKGILDVDKWKYRQRVWTGMGWFQMLSSDLIDYIWSKASWGHPGYDVWDVDIKRSAMKICGMEILNTDKPFFHMYHGPTTMNWKRKK